MPKALALDVIAGLAPEDEQQPEKKIEVVRSPELDEIIAAYEKVLKDVRPHPSFTGYDTVLRFVPKNHSASTITTASIALGQFSDADAFNESAGLYLSALINQSSDTDHTLLLHGYKTAVKVLCCRIHKKMTVTVYGPTGPETALHNKGKFILYGTANRGLGYHNCGTVIVNGNVYGPTGHFNRRDIQIHGDIEGDLGRQNKGEILVHGNVKGRVGGLNGGTITVNGNVEGVVGYENEGTIHLNGDYQTLADKLGPGSIYHKGTLIVEKGRRL